MTTLADRLTFDDLEHAHVETQRVLDTVLRVLREARETAADATLSDATRTGALAGAVLTAIGELSSVADSEHGEMTAADTPELMAARRRETAELDARKRDERAA